MHLSFAFVLLTQRCLAFICSRDLFANKFVFKDYAWTKFAPRDSEKLQRKKESELLNGRLAMLAVGGIATQAVLTGNGFPFV